MLHITKTLKIGSTKTKILAFPLQRTGAQLKCGSYIKLLASPYLFRTAVASLSFLGEFPRHLSAAVPLHIEV